eukprot:Skav233772  [mRNA]  locus=scaffold780:71015:77172:- [translate_table: standard]
MSERVDAEISKRYDIDMREIGIGGYGKVFLAKDRMFKDRQVAIKKASQLRSQKRGAITVVLIMKRLDHPNICRLFETYEQAQHGAAGCTVPPDAISELGSVHWWQRTRTQLELAMHPPMAHPPWHFWLPWLLGLAVQGRLSDLDVSLSKKSQSRSSTVLTELTTFDDKPNPRLTCSKGMAYARQLVQQKFQDLELKPMGSKGNGFRYTVPETQNEECPDGITNLIAGVEGSDETLKNEYLVGGPSRAQGLRETDNSYDDGGSVAALLSIIQYFKDNPIKRSLIIFISDGEEGINNVAVSDEWKQTFCSSSAYLGPSSGCHNYAIGFTAWSKNPTVDLHSVKLVFAFDPLGAPGFEGHDFVAVLGTETTVGLQALLQEGFQGAPTHPLFVNRLYAAQSYSDADALTKNFEPLCSSEEPATCLNGIPAVWFAQTAFAKYHGGVDGNFLLPPLESGQIPFVDVPKELATFALDAGSGYNMLTY